MLHAIKVAAGNCLFTRNTPSCHKNFFIKIVLKVKSITVYYFIYVYCTNRGLIARDVVAILNTHFFPERKLSINNFLTHRRKYSYDQKR